MSERAPRQEQKKESSDWFRWVALGFVALIGLEFLDN